MNTNIYLFTIGFSLILSFVYWVSQDKGKDDSQKLMLFILLFVFVLEFSGNYTASRLINNSLIYNIGWVYIESCLLILYFFKIETHKPAKKWILRLTLLLLVWGLINTLLFQPITQVFQYFSLFPFALFIIFLCIRFLVRVLNLKIFASRNLISLPHFWIIVGMLFFYTQALFLFGMFQFVSESIVGMIKGLSQINRIMAGLMYLFFGLSYLTPHFWKTRLQHSR